MSGKDTCSLLTFYAFLFMFAQLRDLGSPHRRGDFSRPLHNVYHAQYSILAENSLHNAVIISQQRQAMVDVHNDEMGQHQTVVDSDEMGRRLLDDLTEAKWLSEQCVNFPPTLTDEIQQADGEENDSVFSSISIYCCLMVPLFARNSE